MHEKSIWMPAKQMTHLAAFSSFGNGFNRICLVGMASLAGRSTRVELGNGFNRIFLVGMTSPAGRSTRLEEHLDRSWLRFFPVTGFGRIVPAEATLLFPCLPLLQER
jgi:hypothetical protein